MDLLRKIKWMPIVLLALLAGCPRDNTTTNADDGDDTTVSAVEASAGVDTGETSFSILLGALNGELIVSTLTKAAMLEDNMECTARDEAEGELNADQAADPDQLIGSIICSGTCEVDDDESVEDGYHVTVTLDEATPSGSLLTAFPGGTAEIVFAQCAGTLDLDCDDEDETDNILDGTLILTVAEGGTSATVETSDGFTVNGTSLDESEVVLSGFDLTGTDLPECSSDDLTGSYTFGGTAFEMSDACNAVCE